ncbi:MAG: zinc ABC transporter substrate-binding protein [Desulfobacterales bacterium]|nr:zinc ABC transporter substrate-binding protein [Desulfobacterales bacterium]
MTPHKNVKCIKRFYNQSLLIICSIVFLQAAVSSASKSIPVFVSIVPQKYFLEKIGGNYVEVSVMVEPGASPAIYEPKPKQMVALSRTRIYFAIGVPFETIWLPKIAASSPQMQIIHIEDGIEKKSMRSNHPNGIKDPHVWQSPPLVMIQARNILNALIAADPLQRLAYEENYKKFILELVDLDAELRALFLGKKRRMGFMVFHPAWGYFAHAYDLKQVPIEIEGKEPKPADLQRLIRQAKEEDIKTIFVAPQYSTKSAQVIANGIGGQIAFADPLAPQWADNLRRLAAMFKTALR